MCRSVVVRLDSYTGGPHPAVPTSTVPTRGPPHPGPLLCSYGDTYGLQLISSSSVSSSSVSSSSDNVPGLKLYIDVVDGTI